MANPSMVGGRHNLRWQEFHASQVFEALSISYRQLNFWTDRGLVEVECFKSGTRQPAVGPGSQRAYRYEHILELALVRELHRHSRNLDDIKIALSDKPEEDLSWGSVISVYDQTKSGDIFYAVSPEETELDLIKDEGELLGTLATELSCICINLAALKDGIDIKIDDILGS